MIQKLTLALNLALLITISIAFGMEIPSTDLGQDVINWQAGDFTSIPNDVTKTIVKSLINFRHPNKHAGDVDTFYFNVKNIAPFNATCKRLNFLVDPFIVAKITDITNQMPLSQLLLYSLRSRELNNLTRLWIKMGIDLNQRIGPWMGLHTPLCIALQKNASLETIEFILDNTCTNLCNEETESPLSVALYRLELNTQDGIENSDGITLIKLLLKHGAHVNEPNGYGCTPLYFSIVDHVRVDSDNQRSLSSEETHFHNKIMQLLIKHGADVNKASNDGTTPLYKASNPRNEKAIKILIKHGADIEPAIKQGRYINKCDDMQWIPEETITFLQKIDAQVKEAKKNGTALPDDYNSIDCSTTSSEETACEDDDSSDSEK